MLEPGSIIQNYVVAERLGSGGMADVYRCQHRSLGTPFALKVLHTDSKTVRDRLLREGRAQGSVSHPNILAVTDVIEVEGEPGLVMEYVDGPGLDALIQEEGPLPYDVVDTIAQGLMAGMAAAHAQGWIHRDLKPANVLLQRVGERWLPKIADFGLAKALLDGAETVGMTRTGSVMGTAPYMSPEQISDTKSVDHRGDVYALGAVFYEMVTGQRAYPGDDVLWVFARVAAGDYPPPESLRPDLPERMRQAIVGALLTEVDERVPDVVTLQQVWAGEQTVVPPSQHPAPYDDEWEGVFRTAQPLASLQPIPGSDRPKRRYDDFEYSGLVSDARDRRTPRPSPRTPRRTGMALVFLGSLGVAVGLGLLVVTGLWSVGQRSRRTHACGVPRAQRGADRRVRALSLGEDHDRLATTPDATEELLSIALSDVKRARRDEARSLLLQRWSEGTGDPDAHEAAARDLLVGTADAGRDEAAAALSARATRLQPLLDLLDHADPGVRVVTVTTSAFVARRLDRTDELRSALEERLTAETDDAVTEAINRTLTAL